MPKRNYRQNVRLTSRDIANYCQVSKSTVLEWIKSHRLQAFRLPGGHYHIDKKEFKEFLIKWKMPINAWLFGKGNGEKEQ